MTRNWLSAFVVTGIIFGAAGILAAEEPLREGGRTPRDADFEGQAVLEIKSQAGTCYWTVAGDGDLVRLPQEDETFEAILLSARFDGGDLKVTLAGERAPLETTSLGQYDFGLKSGESAKVNPFRGGEAERDWRLRVVPPTEKVDTTNCCSCGLAKLKCCPATNYCIGCGVCGDCCG